MIKTICPYCGGKCKTVDGEDGDPFGKGRTGKTVCTACGRTVSESEPLLILEDELEELMTDTEISDASGNMLIKISATAEGGGVVRKAEVTVPYEDGVYSLGDEYPFGRIDIDRDPPFSLGAAKVQGDEITIANETVKLSSLLTRTISVKLTAYGYGYIPWEETITVTVNIE